jgi:peptidoglycan/xylan/chitin deacetylase (PgdA/CDA1 family)
MRATLTYHSVDESRSPISVAPAAARAHLRWLLSGRVRVLPLDELASHPADGSDAVAVTFDDGFLNARGAMEALLIEGLPVTVFVVSRHAGGTNAWAGRDQAGIPTLPLLSWSDLEHLRAKGATVEAHTRRHLPLTTLSDDALDDELAGGQADLRDRLGVSSRHLAYPYGDHNIRVSERARRFYSFGHTTEFGVLRAGADPLRLPRLDMYYFRDPGALESWGTEAFARRMRWIRLRRRVRALVAR